MSLLGELLNTLFERRYPRTGRGAGGGDDRSLPALAADILGTKGEVSGLALAGEVLSKYNTLEDDRKLEFFTYLTTRMNIDAQAVRDRLDEYEENPNEETYRAYAAAAEPPRQELIRRLNRLPNGTNALVRMRADLLRLSERESALQALDLDFLHLFSSWFNRGFLVKRPITWETPAHVLEKIIAYESVHSIDSWNELRRRLAPEDRRCFAFFHPSMSDEPLIFVEVALTQGIPTSIQSLLAEDRAAIDAADANTATFYSISSCQAGLAGISFGNSLIKQVAADLMAEHPGLETFVTLSPIPRLAQWLEAQDIALDSSDPERTRRLAAHYLTAAKSATGLPYDPVARFHLRNGAAIHAVHAGADTSENGLRTSGGAMVNYHYDLGQVEQNHERYAATGEIRVSAEVRSLASEVGGPV
ncbi:MAG: malonyl-CoA decarboxylase family protein [Rhodobacter sp.]|nr:malonyl-CoA decarboxylase family protein [Rhodobacter sp.]